MVEGISPLSPPQISNKLATPIIQINATNLENQMINIGNQTFTIPTLNL
jgi:hypothetical protein